MNFVMNHATGAGSIARPVDQQSSALPPYHGCYYVLDNSWYNRSVIYVANWISGKWICGCILFQYKYTQFISNLYAHVVEIHGNLESVDEDSNMLLVGGKNITWRMLGANLGPWIHAYTILTKKSWFLLFLIINDLLCRILNKNIIYYDEWFDLL